MVLIGLLLFDPIVKLEAIMPKHDLVRRVLYDAIMIWTKHSWFDMIHI